MNISISSDLKYLAIFSLVLIIPKVFIRLKVPTGITALSIGVIFGFIAPELKMDQLFKFLSQIGITSLFVFAGLEVDVEELKEDRKYLGKFLISSVMLLFAVASLLFYFLDFPFQEAFIYSLGIITPSAGFIINSLHSFDVTNDQEYWIKSKAISKEIIAVLLLFLALQGGNPKSLVISILFYSFLVFFLPVVFRAFFKFISPYAPNTEVPFLVVISLISGVISKELGAYYLVGAFLVGLIASRFKDLIFKKGEEDFFSSLSNFFNVFLPFYFFYAGLKIPMDKVGGDALIIGALAFVLFVPVRILLIHLNLKKQEKIIHTKIRDVAVSLMPTLIFGLVISGILFERAIINPRYLYALIFYTILTSFIPVIFFQFFRKNELK